jgi:O-antigen/teichoic acid export membrane protein
MLWQAFQIGGVKALYMIRLLVLAILLTPADFGLIAIALAATGFLLNLTNFGLIPAVVQAENIDQAKYDAVWTFDITRAVIVTTLTVFFAPLIAEIFAEPRAVPIIQLLAMRPLIESLMSIRVAALNRNLTFRPLAFLKIIEAIFNAMISILLAKFVGVWAMVFGMIGGAASMVIASYILAPYRPQILFNWNAVKPLMKFGGWILVTGVIAMAGNFGLRIVISRQLGAEGLGLYFLAAQLAFLPSEVASEIVGTVAFPLFARLQSNLQQAARAFQAILTGLLALLYPVCALIIVLSPILVQDILGAKWDGTIPLIQILALVTMIGLLGDATIPLSSDANRTRAIFFSHFIDLVFYESIRNGRRRAGVAACDHPRANPLPVLHSRYFPRSVARGAQGIACDFSCHACRYYILLSGYRDTPQHCRARACGLTGRAHDRLNFVVL